MRMMNERDWQPDLYLTFERERGRPLRDLLSGLNADRVVTAIDLGCGPGNSTETLVAMFPGVRVTGVDTSPAMLEQARKRVPQGRFVKADAANWTPGFAPDLILANALLQWLPGHAHVLPHLMSQLSPGGWVAIQMPDNLDEPTHRIMREISVQGPWVERMTGVNAVRADIGSFADYHDWLMPFADEVDVWRTTYVHRLPGHDAIVQWMRGAGLTAYLKRLVNGEEEAFLAAYADRVRKAYPQRLDGTVLLPFPRLFIRARRKPR